MSLMYLVCQTAFISLVRDSLRLLREILSANVSSDWDFKHIGIPKFVRAFENCPIKSVEDIVNFNEAHKGKAMPKRKLVFLWF